MVRKHTIKKALRIKLLTVIMLTAGAVCAFATLGDGKKKTTASTKKKSLLSAQKSVAINSRTFSIKSGYTFRGNRNITPKQETKNYINLNSVVTYQRGATTYQVPVQKKVLLGGNLKLRLYASGSL